MEYIYIGKIVNTHGIKGEIRIISDFKHKNMIFKSDFKLYIGNKKEEIIINTHRFHKIYDMITINGINDINDVLKYKGENIYINKEDLNLEYYLQDLYNLDVYDKDKLIGKVNDIIKNKSYEILVVGKTLIPNIDEFIEKIDIDNKKIYIKNIEGLINEN